MDRPGKENQVADFLSRFRTEGEDVPIFDDFPDEHLFAISIDVPWFVDIANHLVSERLPQYLFAKEKQRIIQLSANYSWVGGDLFRIDPDLIIRRCVREDEIYDILKVSHDEPYVGHFVDKRTTYKVLHFDYYWPTIFKDAKKCVRSCDGCQDMGKPIQRDEMPLQPQVLIKPFERWALDFVGHHPSFQR